MLARELQRAQLFLLDVKTFQVEAVPGEMEARDEEADRVDEDDDDDDEVEIQELGGLVEREAGLTVQTGGWETVVSGNVGEALTTVPVSIEQGHRQGYQGGDTWPQQNSISRYFSKLSTQGHTLTVETGENDVPLGVVNRATGSPHNIGELVREVDRHHVHPDEEADIGVMDGVPEEVADWGEENLLSVDEVKAPFSAIQ